MMDPKTMSALQTRHHDEIPLFNSRIFVRFKWYVESGKGAIQL